MEFCNFYLNNAWVVTSLAGSNKGLTEDLGTIIDKDRTRRKRVTRCQSHETDLKSNLPDLFSERSKSTCDPDGRTVFL